MIAHCFSFFSTYKKKQTNKKKIVQLLYYNHQKIGGPVYIANWYREALHIAGHSTNAADAVRPTHIVWVLESMRTRDWDYLYSRIKKSPTIPTYFVMIKV